MEHFYTAYFEATKTHAKRKIKDLVSQFERIDVQVDDDESMIVQTTSERIARRLFKQGKGAGFKCSLEVATTYDYDDALTGDLGILELGPSSTDQFKATLPRDAFDYSTGCPRCGLGAAQVKPHILTERSVRCSANFYYSDHGHPVMRSEIGREIVKATKQPWCMRHPVTRNGKIVEEWMEPVPCATMPPLSRKSKGVAFGETSSSSGVGEPPQAIEPCPVCRREIWDYDHQSPGRLVYPQAAIEWAQRHAVLVMYEPFCSFPEFDPIKRTFKGELYGLPWLLFNHDAIKVIMKYAQREHIRDSAYIQPVFSE